MCEVDVGEGEEEALGEEQNTAFLQKIHMHGNFEGDTFVHLLAAHNVNDSELMDTYQSLLVVTNKAGKTPVDIARERGFEDWVETAVGMDVFNADS